MIICSEAAPGTAEDFARDGHSPQGDIMKRHKAKGVRRKEVSVCFRFAFSLEPCALPVLSFVEGRLKRGNSYTSLLEIQHAHAFGESKLWEESYVPSIA
jgi:hypothetical protein